MKRINENTIRVILGTDDLEDRGITMLDLLGSQGQIESFFYSILEEVDQDHMFDKSDAVTFQVMPNTNGLELLISKAEVPNGVAKSVDGTFTPSTTREEILQGLDAMSTMAGSSERTTTIQDTKADLKKVYRFGDFEQVINLAKELKVTGLTSSLRVYQETYFLELEFKEENFVEMTPEDTWVIANEFGLEAGKEYAVIRDSAKVLFETDALENLRYYFNN